MRNDTDDATPGVVIGVAVGLLGVVGWVWLGNGWWAVTGLVLTLLVMVMATEWRRP